MISENTIKNRISSFREYKKLYLKKIYISEWVNIGDGDEFQITFEAFVNISTGSSRVCSGVRFHGSGNIVYPGTHCGKIDLDNIPCDVLNRYRKYVTDANRACWCRKKSMKLLRSKDTFIMSNSV